MGETSDVEEDINGAEITGGIFLGNMHAARSIVWLRTRGITHILNVADDVPTYHPKLFQYKRLEVRDHGLDQGIQRVFDEAITFIEDALAAGGKVLVHCLGGVNRSATIIVAYLMKIRGRRLKEAFNWVKMRRIVVAPLPDNLVALIKYERILTGMCNLDIPDDWMRHATVKWELA